MLRKLSNKDLDLIKIAEKGGNDATLLLLDKVHALEDRFKNHVNSMNEMMSLMAQQIKEKLEQVEKATPDWSEALASIRGRDGKDSAVPGPKGEKGERGFIGPAGKDGRDGRDGRDGYTPQKGIDYFDGKDADEEKILDKIEKNLPKLGIAVRDALELLQGKERLNKSAIRDLEEELKKPSESAKEKVIIKGGGGINVVQYVDLSNQLNGSTKTFYLGSHFGIIAILSSSTPFIFRPTTDYVESGVNVVFDAGIDAAISLATGQSVIALVKRRG